MWPDTANGRVYQVAQTNQRFFDQHGGVSISGLLLYTTTRSADTGVVTHRVLKPGLFSATCVYPAHEEPYHDLTKIWAEQIWAPLRQTRFKEFVAALVRAHLKTRRTVLLLLVLTEKVEDLASHKDVILQIRNRL